MARKDKAMWDMANKASDEMMPSEKMRVMRGEKMMMENKMDKKKKKSKKKKGY